MKVAIVSYGTGNIASLQSALRSLNATSYLAENIADFKKADSIIFPGVGHFEHAAKNLEELGIKNHLINLIKDGIPTLGICLGFQLLTRSSEESSKYLGLGLLPLKTLRIEVKNTLLYKVPHMGWNAIKSLNKRSKLLKNIKLDKQVFYYSNAYGVLKKDLFKGVQACYEHEKEMMALAEYKNIYGVQFHPEKSRSQGLTLLRNFLY